MNKLKKSFLVSTVLLWGMLDTWAMQELELESGKHIKTRQHVIDGATLCQGGKFNFFKKGINLYVEPNKPAKAPTQTIQIYNGQPQIFPAEEKLLMRLKPGFDGRARGFDGRARIKETTQWPYLLNGQLDMQYLDGQYGGSGILVGPHHILTAGHNVYSADKKQWANAISVRLGLNKRAAPFGEIKAAKVYTFNSWVEEGNPNYDMALIVLNRSVGFETGWCGLLCLDDEALLKEEVAITGYPGDKGFNKMMTMSHKVRTVELEKLYYDIDTFGGQSGSGIRIDKWGSPYVVGIHTHGEGVLYTGNSGVRLSQDKFNKVIEWISESLILQENLPPQPQPPIRIVIPEVPVRAAIPDIARGYEEIYERFLKGVLIYRPQEGSDVGKIEMPIVNLANPLEGTFDLSSCGDTGRYLSIATGYRKVQTPANANKVEIWFTPRFLVDKEMPQLAQNHHMRAISGNWDAARAPIGIFWTWGGWNASNQIAYCDYLTAESMDAVASENLLKKYQKSGWHFHGLRGFLGCGAEQNFTFRL